MKSVLMGAGKGTSLVSSWFLILFIMYLEIIVVAHSRGVQFEADPVSPSSSLAEATAIDPPSKPNVIIIILDDVGYGNLRFANGGKPGPRTPHLDSLARDSVFLTDFHVSTSCSPTRASLMTGRFSSSTGVWHTIEGRSQLLADEVTMADVFRANGFATGLFGKWHLGDNAPFRPQERGFDQFVGFNGGALGQTPSYWGSSNWKGSMLWDNNTWMSLEDEDDGIPGAYSTNFFFGRAMRFIKENMLNNRSTLTVIAPGASHTPLQRPPDARRSISTFWAIIENVDKNIARLNALLSGMFYSDGTRLYDHTLVMVLSDNGGSKPFIWRGIKLSPFDGGHISPCLIRWPNRTIGGPHRNRVRRINALVSHVDILPTFLDMLQLEDVLASEERAASNRRLDGVSIRTLLEGTSANLGSRLLYVDTQRQDSAVQYRSTAVMQDDVDPSQPNIIRHKWRLVWENPASPATLYDVLSDKAQRRGVSMAKASNKMVAERLKRFYDAVWENATAPRTRLYAEIHLGGSAGVTTLNSMDLHGGCIYEQSKVAEGVPATGRWAVRFVRPGMYLFRLRRWPEEIANISSLTSVPTVAGSIRKSFYRPSPRIRGGVVELSLITNASQVIYSGFQQVTGDEDSVDIQVSILGPASFFLRALFTAGESSATRINHVYYTSVQRSGP